MKQKNERPSELKTGPIESKRTLDGFGYASKPTSGIPLNQVNFSVTAKDWVDRVKNTMQGFCSLVIEPVGLEVKSCMLHKKDDSRWISLPAKEYINASGEKQWTPFLLFSDKEKKMLFQKMALEAIARLRGEA